MPLSPKELEDRFVTQRLKNQTATAEGAILPGRVISNIRVPFVQGLEAAKLKTVNEGTLTTLTWLNPDVDPTNPISHFLIHVSSPDNKGLSAIFNIQASQAPVVSIGSPATILLPGNESKQATLTVQTVLKNGQTSNLEESPTITVPIGLPLFSSKAIAFADSPYTPKTEFYIDADATTGDILISIPQTNRKLYTIKKSDSSVNIVEIETTDGLIQGASSYTLTAARETILIYCDGTNWHILSSTTI